MAIKLYLLCFWSSLSITLGGKLEFRSLCCHIKKPSKKTKTMVRIKLNAKKLNQKGPKDKTVISQQLKVISIGKAARITC